MKFDNVYMEHNGLRYCGYSIYFSQSLHNRATPESFTAILDSKIYDKLANLSIITCDDHPAKQSEIYLSPRCPASIEDIRNNYTIKRKPDSGDYNVFSPYTKGAIEYISSDSTLFIPSRSAIIASYVKKDEATMWTLAKSYLPDLTGNETAYYINTVKWFYLCDIEQAYLELLKNSLKKPCISYKNLDLNSNNELTVDVLRLVYETGNVYAWKDNAQENFILQLNILNQHNWREYPGTVSMVVTEMCNAANKVAHGIIERPSCFSKTIREIVSYQKKKFESEKDLLLAQAFVNSLMDVGDYRFTTLQELCKKLGMYGVNWDRFYSLYNNMMKLTPAKFNNES